jgi:hypothetical protein
MTNSWRGGTVISKKPLAHNAIAESETRVLEAVIWLPVGKYFSEVNGEVFEVTEDSSMTASDKTNYWTSSQESSFFDSETTDHTVLSYAMTQAQRCHRRILLGSVRAFQKIYRRYKKDFLTTNLWAYLALKKHLRRYLEYVRGMIAHRKASTIASLYRMHTSRRVYRLHLSCIVLLQCAIRKFLAKRYSAILRRSRILVIRVLARYSIRRQVIRQRKARLIQCLYRRHLAILKRNRQLVHRRIFRALKRWLKHNVKVRTRVEELGRQQLERDLMSEAEEYQREYLRQAEAEQRRKIREKLFQVERKRNGMAIILQRNYRRHFHQQRYRILCRGVSKLQVPPSLLLPSSPLTPA